MNHNLRSLLPCLLPLMSPAAVAETEDQLDAYNVVWTTTSKDSSESMPCGGVFTAQNQRLIYWPMLKSGDADAILPQFELYRKALPGARARVKANFGHEGAVYSEYLGASGLALGSGYGWDEGDDRGQGDRSYSCWTAAPSRSSSRASSSIRP